MTDNFVENITENAASAEASEMDAEKHNQAMNEDGQQAEKSKVEELVAADEKEYGYGERTCLQCGKKFIAMHFAQICCSDECRKARRKNNNRANASRQLTKLHAKIQRLENDLAVANGIIDGLKLELGRSASEPQTPEDAQCQ